MTKSEAAKICQSIKFMMDIEDYSEEVEEALNMAIAALKQLSLPKIIIRQGEQEPCEYKRTDKRTETHACDCISRQDAIDVVRQYCIDNQIEDGDYHANGIEYEMNELPTAQPFTEEQIQTMQELESAQIEKAYELGKADRPKGRWHIEPGIGCFCSKCSFDIGNDLDFMEYVHYCPNCGSYNGGDADGSD